MRILECPIFPVALALVTEEKEFYQLTKKSCHGEQFPATGTATTICFSGEGTVILVVLGEPDAQDTNLDVESILTHEAVHVKQYVFEELGEKTPGVETEAYLVQYFARYLINEWHYRQNKKEKKECPITLD